VKKYGDDDDYENSESVQEFDTDYTRHHLNSGDDMGMNTLEINPFDL
jgi:hypothetical protein